MILTGISDEAGTVIEKQIEAHQQLGWDYMELRLIDGKNIAGELSDEDFDQVVRVMEENQMKAAGFASAIGNWSRPITGDFSLDTNDLKITIILLLTTSLFKVVTHYQLFNNN